MAGAEAQLQDLYKELGVQGHAGAVAEIRSLRKTAGLDQPGGSSVMDRVRDRVRVLHRWIYCMSYDASYVGEPAGLFKRELRELDHLVDPQSYGAPTPNPR